MSKFDCVNYVVHVLKAEHEWLKEPDKYALTNSVFAMDNAYKGFLRCILVIRNLRVNTIIDVPIRRVQIIRE